MTPDAPYEVLLVEDNAADVRLLQEALDAARANMTIMAARDGGAALRHLGERAQGPPGRLPHLILLDLNMPRMGGMEFLERLRADPDLQEIPVVVFTSSRASDDVQASAAAGANGYIVKTHDFDELTRLIQTLEARWPRSSPARPSPTHRP